MQHHIITVAERARVGTQNATSGLEYSYNANLIIYYNLYNDRLLLKSFNLLFVL